jgi:hypothetical protein
MFSKNSRCRAATVSQRAPDDTPNAVPSPPIPIRCG